MQQQQTMLTVPRRKQPNPLSISVQLLVWRTANVEGGPTGGRAGFEDAGSAVRSLGSVATPEKTGGARRRRRLVRNSFCGDGECASSWQTSSQRLFSVDERLGLVTGRPYFQSPRSPSRVADCRFSARGNLH
eukprot:1961488-Pleurochrysis_carterae.AAC.1